jgi:hypothetical protein
MTRMPDDRRAVRQSAARRQRYRPVCHRTNKGNTLAANCSLAVIKGAPIIGKPAQEKNPFDADSAFRALSKKHPCRIPSGCPVRHPLGDSGQGDSGEIQDEITPRQKRPGFRGLFRLFESPSLEVRIGDYGAAEAASCWRSYAECQ